MAVSTLAVPSMYADHHVTAVRKALSGLPGVQDIEASAAFRQITVKHTKKATKKALAETLEKAGYPAGEEEPVEEVPSHLGDPSWYECAPRSTKTDPADLEMSGDFRMY
ncbi:MAG: heavy metal-associated domain-containing protein [Anaerolineae bacterium]